VTPPSIDRTTIPPKGVTTAYDPLAGTISGAALLEDEQKTLLARQELAREAEAKRRAAELEAEARRREAEAEEQKRKAEEDKRDAERKHLEELVAQQTKALEEKLTQLASTMSPKTTAVTEAESTQVQRGSATVSENSFPRVPSVSSQFDASFVPRKRSFLPLILIVLLVLLVGGAAGTYLILKSRTIATAEPGKTSDGSNEAPVKAAMVDIPGGTFQMGRNGSLPQEAPAHTVTVQSFSMDKTEVTNAEYAQFVKLTNHQPPEHWGGIKPPVGEDLFPVSNVTYDDAVAFAAWRSKRDGVTYRLPTEEEWEFAARNGDKDNLYPWGNSWETGRAATQEAGVGKAQVVGSFRDGGNRWGVQDLMGNVWEFTSTRASVYSGNAAKLPEQVKDWIVVRGGSFQSQAKGERPVSGTLRDWVAPNYKHITLGFRLVKSGS
jgi:formylglycine-generating enzyme required for sulfatase activity